MNRFLTLLLILISASITTIKGQSAAPIIVQAATPPPATTPAPAPVTPESTVTAIKMLQEIKAANAETLKKQQAALEQLDELTKQAEQIKIFGKRG